MSETITQAVKDRYGSVATSGLSSDHEGVKAVAEAFGYTPEELASIPAEANMGLACGNPTATANLREGNVNDYAASVRVFALKPRGPATVAIEK